MLLKPVGRGPCLPTVAYFIPELNLDLARNSRQRETQTRYSSYRQKEQDKTSGDKTNKTCTKKTCSTKTKIASERAKTAGGDWEEKGSSLAFLFVRTSTIKYSNRNIKNKSAGPG